MHIPLPPPNYDDLVTEIIDNSDRYLKIISVGVLPDPQGEYYHWDKLRHLTPPVDLSSRDWWFGIKSARKGLYQRIPHLDKNGAPFVFAEPNVVRRLLHKIDIHGGGELRTSSQVANLNSRESYLINSLIEEAITSSQLEGAATTRKVAKEMLRQKRTPKDNSERMIVNNYYAMEYIREIANQELTPNLILELHQTLTQDTLENSEAIGNIRTSDDIQVADQRDATILHVPPQKDELPERLKSICQFANDSNDETFLHPVIRAIILHFLLAYDHPFEDGNGRTARALFYWLMLRQGYWTTELISISRILKKAPAQYNRSYLYTETDDNDVTYFIVHQLKVIDQAINALLIYLKRKSDDHNNLEHLLRNSLPLQQTLNHRQIAALNRAIKHPDSLFTVQSHRGAHKITYDTARTDLLKLVELDLLDKTKIGRAFAFVPHPNLMDKLQSFKS